MKVASMKFKIAGRANFQNWNSRFCNGSNLSSYELASHVCGNYSYCDD